MSQQLSLPGMEQGPWNAVDFSRLPTFTATEDRRWPAGFDYGRTPAIFGDRAGRGPLIVAWDTNIVIDYSDHRDQMWDSHFEPATSDEAYAEDLLALGRLITHLFPWREIGIWVSPQHVEDDRHSRLHESAKSSRRSNVAHFWATTDLLGERGLIREVSEAVALRVESALDFLPDGPDRRLVAEALVADCHVFLTRDKRVLGAADRLRGRLAVMTPSQLWAALDDAGEVSWADWSVLPGALFPDLQRVSEVIGIVR